MAFDAREAALEVLTSCRKAEAWTDGALRSALKRAKLDARDGALAARLAYGVVQNRYLLNHYISMFCKQKAEQLEPVIADILRIAVYQILFLDKIPHSAAVNRAVEMTKGHQRAKAAGMVNAVLRNLIRNLDQLVEPEELSVRFSHPKWLCDRYVELLGREEAAQLMAVQNEPVPMSVQRNPLKASREHLEEELAAANVSFAAHPWLPDCYEVQGTGDLEALSAFREGLFTVQDPAAHLAVMAAEPESGMSVLDVCAAPGGKSFAAAMLMDNQGSILSRDIHPHKLKLMTDGAARLGITCMETALGDGRACGEEMYGKYDLVICDVPCSGLGVIRKKPDIRYKKAEELSRLPEIQRAILESACHCVAPGGVLLYSTCTVLPEENEGVADSFLKEHSELEKEIFTLPEPIGKVEGDITLWPHRHGTDGFYICRMRRKD